MTDRCCALGQLVQAACSQTWLLGPWSMGVVRLALPGRCLGAAAIGEVTAAVE